MQSRRATRGALEPVAIAGPSPGDLIDLAVWRTSLDREISPEGWLDAFVESRGESPVHAANAPTPDDRRAVAVVRGDAGLGEYTAAYAALKSGPMLAVFRAAAPGRSDAATARIRDLALEARLDSPDSWPFAERLLRLSPRHPVDFVTLYPESWTRVNEVENTHNLTAVRLRNAAHGLPVGEVTVTALRSAPDGAPESLLRAIAQHAGGSQDAGPALVPGPSDPPHGAEAAWRADGRTRRGTASIDIDARIYRTPQGWLVVTGWTLARSIHAATWAINRRAFEIVTRFLRFGRPLDADPDYAPLLAAASTQL